MKYFNKISVTTVSCEGNNDKALTPPNNNGNYIPIMARPLSTWNTVGVIVFMADNSTYYIHAKGSDTQSYEIVWLVSQ